MSMDGLGRGGEGRPRLLTSRKWGEGEEEVEDERDGLLSKLTTAVDFIASSDCRIQADIGEGLQSLH